MDEIDPRQLALIRLSVREYGSGEMRAYLRRKGVDEPEAQEIVAELVKSGQISDERYSRVITRHQAHRGKGPHYIVAKLREKGVKTDARKVREFYREAAPMDELETARRVVEIRYPRAFEDEAERRRAYQALLRRGFSSDVASRCVNKSGSTS